MQADFLPAEPSLIRGEDEELQWSSLEVTLLEEQGLPGGSDGKESARNAEDPGWIPGLGRSPGGGPQYSCLENPDGQRNLLGCSP